MFPATQVVLDEDRCSKVAGLSRSHWSNASPIRSIFKEAFAGVGPLTGAFKTTALTAFQLQTFGEAISVKLLMPTPHFACLSIAEGFLDRAGCGGLQADRHAVTTRWVG